MNILFIEDDDSKIESVIKHIDNLSCDFSFTVKKSLQSGLKEIIENQIYDYILLDMALPNYDISPTEPDGGSPESFAGRDILFQLKLRNIDVRALVITQFDTFGEDGITLNELKDQLEREFPDNYLGTVYFDITSDSWKKSISEWVGGLDGVSEI